MGHRRVFSICVFVLLLPLLGWRFEDQTYVRPFATYRCFWRRTLESSNVIFTAQILDFNIFPSLSPAILNFAFDPVNNGWIFTANCPLFPWYKCAFDCFMANEAFNAVVQGRYVRIRRYKRPCAYYSNSTATFRPLLIGDLVFKLNPGP